MQNRIIDEAEDLTDTSTDDEHMYWAWIKKLLIHETWGEKFSRRWEVVCTT